MNEGECECVDMHGSVCVCEGQSKHAGVLGADGLGSPGQRAPATATGTPWALARLLLRNHAIMKGLQGTPWKEAKGSGSG